MSSKGNLQVTTPSDLEIRIQRRFDASKQVLFDAWTRPEITKKWLHGSDDHTLEVFDIDLRPGGKLRYVWRGEDGSTMGVSGEFKEVSPPDRIVHTELFDEDWTGGETLVTIEFEQHDDHATITMTIRYSSKEARDGALQSPMAEGMEVCYARLDKILHAPA